MKAEKIIRLRIQNSTFCRRIRVVQGDTGRIFRFILEDIALDGSEQARVYAKKPDGTEVYNDCEVVSPNEVLMESDSGQIFAAIGVVPAEIQISKSGKTITTYTFEFNMEKSLTRTGAIQSSNEYGALETALAKAEGFYNPTFSEAATRNNINSGESIPTLFGKVKKWFTDLNALIRLVGDADISGIGKGTVTDALLTLNSKAFFTDIEYGTATITGESNHVAFSKKHSEKPRIILLTYSEENSSIGGEPKELKIYAKTLTGFGVAVSVYDGTNRNFSWIAIW